MHGISPDEVIVFRWQWFVVNYTILFTWLIMLAMTLSAWFVTRKSSKQKHSARWQHFFEVIILK